MHIILFQGIVLIYLNFTRDSHSSIVFIEVRNEGLHNIPKKEGNCTTKLRRNVIGMDISVVKKNHHKKCPSKKK
jgi:hypothetical protein